MARTTLRAGASAALALAAAIALVLAAWSGWSWYAAAHDESVGFASARDMALAAGEQAVQNLNTLDHRDLKSGLDSWEASTTGDLREELREGRDEFEKQVRAARTVTAAKVLSGALSELDQRSGRASVLIALRITVDAPDEKPSSKESRLLGELTRTDSGWKLSGLGQAPTGETATGN
jgi:Mce-associated membrane protein